MVPQENQGAKCEIGHQEYMHETCIVFTVLTSAAIAASIVLPLSRLETGEGITVRVNNSSVLPAFYLRPGGDITSIGAPESIIKVRQMWAVYHWQ